MTGRGLCVVEILKEKPIRIFRSNKASAIAALHGAEITVMSRVDATREIREQVFYRSEGACEFCGSPITWGTCHLHERLPRGKGGEISLENSVAICYECHEGRKDSEHGDRKLQFGGENGN